MKKEAKIDSARIKFPWGKLSLLLLFTALVVVGSEILANNIALGDLKEAYLSPGQSSIWTNPYIYYSIIGLIIIAIAVLIISRRSSRKETIPERQVREATDKELKKILKTVDGLLEKLPEDEIQKFSESDDAELYKKVMERYGI